MKRYLFNVAAALSLVLCIAVGVLWARGKQRYAPEMAQAWYNHWPQQDESYAWFVEAASYSDTLALRFDLHHMEPRHWQSMSGEERKQMLGNFPAGLRTNFMLRQEFWEGCSRQSGFGLRYEVSTRWKGYTTRYFMLTVRPWLPMAALGVMPGFWVMGFWKSRRARGTGLCAVCGYDLRATPARCPECGTIPKARMEGAIAPTSLA